MTPIVTLLTDFGLRDPYVGIMKAVILSTAPTARLVDLTHQVGPQNILQGAFALASAVRYCPPATVHLAVVDPGVGSGRDAIVVQTHRARYVAPNNGLLTLALENDRPVRAWRLNRPQYFLPEVSRTFHGRDIFAPVAGHLACGRSPEDMGEPLPLDGLVKLTIPRPEETGGGIRARVVYVDRFGNLVTNLMGADIEHRPVRSVRIAQQFIPFAHTYASVPKGDYLCIWGSTGNLEIACSMGDAGGQLSVGEGVEVTVFLEDSSEAPHGGAAGVTP